MAYQISPFTMTLSNIRGHSPFYKCDFSYSSCATVKKISDDTEHQCIMVRLRQLFILCLYKRLFTSDSNGCAPTNQAGALTVSGEESLIVVYSFGDSGGKMYYYVLEWHLGSYILTLRL